MTRLKRKKKHPKNAAAVVAAKAIILLKKAKQPTQVPQMNLMRHPTKTNRRKPNSKKKKNRNAGAEPGRKNLTTTPEMVKICSLQMSPLRKHKNRLKKHLQNASPAAVRRRKKPLQKKLLCQKILKILQIHQRKRKPNDLNVAQHVELSLKMLPHRMKQRPSLWLCHPALRK